MPSGPTPDRRQERERDEQRDRRETPSDRKERSDPVRALHRSVGNQAVKSMAERGALAPPGGTGVGGSRSVATTASPTPALSRTSGPVVQRQTDGKGGGSGESGGNDQTKEYKEAGGKLLSGLRKTELGKKVQDKGEQYLLDFWNTTAGKITLPIAGAGGLVLMDGPLPFSAPAVPVHSVFGLNENTEKKNKLFLKLNLVGLPKGEAPYAADKIKGGVTWEHEQMKLGTDVMVGTGKAGKEGHTHSGPGAGNLEWKLMVNFQTKF